MNILSEKQAYEKILSVQPFWEAERKNKYIITDPELNGPVAVVYEIIADPGVKGLKSIPGIAYRNQFFLRKRKASSNGVWGLEQK